MSRWHVVGAGIAGLAAATALAARGERVTLYEAARHAGGRCRSYHDPKLGCRIDNGNHLVLSGNRATGAYLERIGARHRLHEIRPAAFPFLDLATGERWTLRPGRGPLPLWLADPARRPPGVPLRELGRGLGFLVSGRADRAGAVVGAGVGYERFWDPLVTAVLNTPPAEGAAALMRPVLLETFAKGEAACRPLIAETGLGDAFVEPALAFLARSGAEVRLATPVSALDDAGARVCGLRLGGTTVPLGGNDAVIVATPPWITAELVPGLAPLPTFSPIVNAHFRLADDGPAEPELLGLVGGRAQWIFRRGPIASVTVSAARALVDRPADEIARRLWADVARALGRAGEPLPPWRVVKEKRATPWQSPASARNRWSARTSWRNVALAGDWVATGLPATIESAVRSGEQAVRLLQRRPLEELVGTERQRIA